MTLRKYFFLSHTIGPADILNPPQGPHFKTFQVFLIYFPKCPSFRTIQSYPRFKCSTLILSSLNCSPVFGEKSLLVECCFSHSNRGFNFTCTHCSTYFHFTQIVEMFPILRLFFIYHNPYWGRLP